MGFFSAVKKFFGQKPSEEATAPVQEPVPEIRTDINEAAGKQGISPEISEIKNGSPELPAESAPVEESPENERQSLSDNLEIVREQIDQEILPETVDGEATSAKDEDAAQAIIVNDVCEPADDGAQIPEPVVAEAAGQKSIDADRSKQDAMLVRLRKAEPRLSAWLDIILEDQDEVNEEFWSRLRFLLVSLEAPNEEIESFITGFAGWLERMEYAYVDEFRSELQYRLALALDLEDEEDERNRLIVKLGEGLAATRARFGRGLDALFAGHGKINDSFWEEMEELFITADMGYETSLEIVERLKTRAVAAKISDPAEVRQLLKDELEEVFRQTQKIRAANKPEVILMMGVNGAGKTTTIAKLAYRDILNGKKTLVVAADTFRAAAMEQLKVWAERAGSDFYARPAGSDPASVAWEAMDYALVNNIDVVYIDTAGRLQTRVNLMEELGKIRQVLAKKHPGSPHRNVLVLDATTGQNALSQAKLFKEAAGADEIILTKLDGTAKGGVVISIAMRENLPITFIGLGEKMEDLRPFKGGDFARALLETKTAA